MTTVTNVDEGLRCIDLDFQGQPGVIAAYLLEDTGDRALIEIGPSSTLPALLHALAQIQVDPNTISKILVTHIHLDHAGAAGTFIRRFPGAKLYVHERGTSHMIAPERLLSSARRIYGGQMDTLWGDFEAVPESNVHSLVDGDVISVGSRPLTAVYTPGHASHHVAYHDTGRNGVFTGDVAAARLQGHSYVRPPTPPPDLDLQAWRESVTRLQSVNPDALYLTHFGPFTDVEAHLRQIDQRLEAWSDLLLLGLRAGRDRAHLIEDLRRFGDREIAESTDVADAELMERYELATPYFVSVDGFLRYFKKLGHEVPTT